MDTYSSVLLLAHVVYLRDVGTGLPGGGLHALGSQLSALGTCSMLIVQFSGWVGKTKEIKVKTCLARIGVLGSMPFMSLAILVDAALKLRRWAASRIR